MVDEIRVLRLLRAVTDALALLDTEASAVGSRRADPMWLPGVKYTFIAAIEACVDVVQHICSAEGWGPPADNGDAVRLLGAHGALTKQLAEQIRKAVGFRNVLVHEYVTVSDDIVLAQLSDLSDLRSFVRQVTAYLHPQEFGSSP
jgi:uncharacterized protein YutE (UPF0331/DUF86 family)